MKSIEDRIQVFIVRAWLEAREIEGKSPEWRGIVVNVTTGERRYWKNLDEVMAFLLRYVPRSGATIETKPPP